MSIDTALIEHASNPLVELNPNAILVVENMEIKYANEAAGHVFHTLTSDLTHLTLENLNQNTIGMYNHRNTLTNTPLIIPRLTCIAVIRLVQVASKNVARIGP